jgi:hypothetical protein
MGLQTTSFTFEVDTGEGEGSSPAISGEILAVIFHEYGSNVEVTASIALTDDYGVAIVTRIGNTNALVPVAVEPVDATNTAIGDSRPYPINGKVNAALTLGVGSDDPGVRVTIIYRP